MGGKQLRGLGGARGEEGIRKAMGKSHRVKDLAQRMRTHPGFPRKSGFFHQKKKIKNWGLEKKVLWTLVDANKLLLKGSSFMERLSWFFASPLRKLPEYWKKSENLGNSGSLAFPTHRGKFPRDLFPSSHTRHDPNSRSQLPARKGQFLNASDLFSPV